MLLYCFSLFQGLQYPFLDGKMHNSVQTLYCQSGWQEPRSDWRHWVMTNCRNCFQLCQCQSDRRFVGSIDNSLVRSTTRWSDRWTDRQTWVIYKTWVSFCSIQLWISYPSLPEFLGHLLCSLRCSITWFWVKCSLYNMCFLQSLMSHHEAHYICCFIYTRW